MRPKGRRGPWIQTVTEVEHGYGCKTGMAPPNKARIPGIKGFQSYIFPKNISSQNISKMTCMTNLNVNLAYML